MSEAMIAIALWCGQPYLQENTYSVDITPTPRQVNQCRERLLGCLWNSDHDVKKCFLNEKYPDKREEHSER